MTLLDLGSKGLSLEFARTEWPAILAELRRLAGSAGIRRDRRATYDVVSVGGSDFVLMDEWDEPCLIAGEPAGGALLRDLFGRLDHDKEVRLA